MPKAFSELEKQIIRQRLLDQGYKQFSVYGLKKTNIEEIAKAAGISKGAFYGFYESKEELFMDVIEETEVRVRKELLAAIELPGHSPRARLYQIFKKAISLFSSIPILHIFSGGDIELLFQRVPGKKLQDHLSSDLAFFEELISRCQAAGIPIQVKAEKVVSLFYPLVVSIMQQGEFPQKELGGNLDVLLELIAAYCMGEVELKLQDPISSDS
jgi:AcrR family transcriptional regulator